MNRLPPASAAIGCLAIILIIAVVPSRAADPTADPHAPAELVVTDQVLRPRDKVPPLGANGWGRSGAVEWAANNFVHNPGNEPIHWRNLHRVKQCGPNWLEIDGPGTSWYDLWYSGFLSGARLRIYRLVDRQGQPLPPKDDYLDIVKADHVQAVGTATVIPEGAPGFPDGGWIANTWCISHPNGWIRHGNLRVTDTSGIENGRTYWYTVVAVGADNQESQVAGEVSATPQAGADTPPHVLIAGNDDELPILVPGRPFEFTPKVFGGRPPYQWQVLDSDGQPMKLPQGLNLDPATGRISGTPQADAEQMSMQLQLRLQVTDALGRSESRQYSIKDTAPLKPSARSARKPGPKPAVTSPKPAPPGDLAAVAGDRCVTISWKSSSSPNVVAYRLKRSTAPAARQEQRVYLSEGAPKLEKWDYVVVEKKFGNLDGKDAVVEKKSGSFDMKYVNPRVRGIGNPVDSPAWYWNADLSQVSFSLAPHPQPLPADMLEPGETCLQVHARPGEQSISQTVFIGTEMEGESIWYGQLEPGKSYRLEVWLRQEGLGNDGAVTFSYGRGYPDIRRTLAVTGQWKKYSYDFTGPPRPGKQWHFGHTFAFTGPGTLWMDNCRIFRLDREEDAAKLCVPNPAVLDELLASQPPAGPKGAHRIWFLARDAAMSSILSRYANARVSPDWRTTVAGTMDMTLPMGLEFDLATGRDAPLRMRPWLVLQHILHSEQDWLNFIEYLAAPYDPQRDTPQSKPWAYRRCQQRGIATPWTDEFAEILVEFGNETWHNGVFADWLGFGRYHAVWQGGPEYGLFSRYLIETMKTSPYWKSQRLDAKIRFCLGAGYNGSVDKDGKVRGYGEEAMQTCPHANYLGHANYVGPKWETGDKSQGIFDDHGVQGTLLGFLAGPAASQVRMAQARDALARSHHPYDLAAYEGGPSGYALPGRDSPAEKLVNERYGKSLAMAVAALDAWMRSYQYGWTYQCFLGYGQGLYWNSHTPLWDGLRPSPGWQALALRNRWASGDLMAVEEKTLPTILWDKKVYPLAGAYAMRDGSRWMVIVVSRKLDGLHDSIDFGDGHTPVTLRLPLKKTARITLHKLTGDPRQSNRQKLVIAPQTQEIPPAALADGKLAINAQTGGGENGLPPGSIFLYVIEGAE